VLNELSNLRSDLDPYYTNPLVLAPSDDYQVWKKEKAKWEYYTAKLLIFQVYMTNTRNFYLGVMS
jgi:hypothetical protein